MARKRDSRGYFTATVELGRDASGKRLRKYVRAKTLAKLREKVAEAEQDKGSGHALAGPDETLEAFLKRWLESVAKQKNRPRTVARYKQDIYNHIIPRIGKRRLRGPTALTTQHVQIFVNDLRASGLARNSVRNVHAVLRTALNTAKTWKLVKENVAIDVALPADDRQPAPPVTAEQARRFLSAVQDDRHMALYWLALTLGLRQGELLGLRWEDIDFERGELFVRGQIARVKQGDEKSKLAFVPTKTRAGVRPLPLIPPLPAVLKAHRHRQDDERTFSGWQEHGYVFPSERGTPLEAQNLVSRSFKPALKRAGLPDMPFHNLRHGCASLLIALGVDPATVSAILGHTSKAFTMQQYVHALPDMTRQALERLGELLHDDSRVLEMPPRKAEKPS